MIRVLVADDHPIARAIIGYVIAGSSDIEVIAEAGNGTEVVELVEQIELDLVLLDIEMPEMGGTTVLQRLQSTHPTLPVLFLSQYPLDHMTEGVLKRGAKGCLTKERVVEDLLLTIRTLMSELRR